MRESLQEEIQRLRDASERFVAEKELLVEQLSDAHCTITSCQDESRRIIEISRREKEQLIQENQINSQVL